MADLDGRTALVTGGGRGIGAAIAVALAEAVRKLGRRTEIYQADVADFAACETTAQRAQSDLGAISILISNSGIASRGNSNSESDPAEMERVVRTHAFGSWYMAHLLVPAMRKLDRRDVIQITSGATQSLGANGSPYNMGKAAQEAMACTLAKEERTNGIHVNIVAPGLVDTEMGTRLMRAVAGVDSLRELDETSPFGHVCTPREIADVVVFLCSPRASYVTHQRIYVNGGGF